MVCYDFTMVKTKCKIDNHQRKNKKREKHKKTKQKKIEEEPIHQSIDTHVMALCTLYSLFIRDTT